MFLHLNIRVWFTHLHPSNGENRTSNRSNCSKSKRALKAFFLSHIYQHFCIFILFAFRNFTKDDILVHIENDAVSFVVIDPDSDTDKPLAGSQVRDAINGDFLSILYRLSLTVPTNPSEDEERDWPLILGLSIGGALLLGLFIMIIIYM